MKIAMVGQFPPHIGGVGVHIHTLSKELVKRGHEVYVITYPHKDIKDIDGIHVIPTKGINIPLIRGLMFKIASKRALNKLLKSVDIDIIHGHYLYPAGASAVEVGKKHSIKTYVTAHGSDMFEMYKKQSYMKSSIEKVLKDADVVLAVSNALKHEILSTDVEGIKDKTRLYWNSVDVNRFKPKHITNEIPKVMFVGNLIKRKNVDLLLEAKKIAKSNYELVIVGDGPLSSTLKNKVREKKIDNVTFTGSCRDVENIIPTCDVLVLPSLSESFGLVLIEALACSKPVIGSDVGGIKEIITDDVGLLIDPSDVKSLSCAIDRLVDDEEFRHKLSLNARSRAINFSKVNIPYDEVVK